MELTGLFFEDFVEGRSFQTGPRTVTAADIAAFAVLSGDKITPSTTMPPRRSPRASAPPSPTAPWGSPLPPDSPAGSG